MSDLTRLFATPREPQPLADPGMLAAVRAQMCWTRFLEEMHQDLGELRSNFIEIEEEDRCFGCRAKLSPGDPILSTGDPTDPDCLECGAGVIVERMIDMGCTLPGSQGTLLPLSDPSHPLHPVWEILLAKVMAELLFRPSTGIGSLPTPAAAHRS